ncbi:heavy metal translocating P-type ATPase [uncultured Streptococcus sp.]|uniref:heavy metal translocating P-type ATPase n=1 Tax=uncultured Streptococcus sp. TaxID=83427 RepID=UPI0027DB77D2|nr:heavy metal translocating P-type ATPase [uncultured Streptococcus sp.]
MMQLRKFMLTLMVGAFALISEFIFHQSGIAYLIVAVAGGFLALIMLIDMIKTLREGKYGVDILAITAIISTLAVGDYWASLMILIMLTGGESLEEYASKQASRELQALLDNSPRQAHCLRDGNVVDIPVDQVQIDDIVLVKPNEIVPVDGVLIKGNSSLNEASLTGESVPVDKTIGDELLSGSINDDQAIQFKVTKLAKDSQYQFLVNLVRQSEKEPAHFVRLADRYAVPFTIAAYVIGGLAWFVSKDPMRFAQVLVVASPCPLILAAPIALVAGMSRSSREGVVVKSGTTFELLAKAKTVAFDKTGTITSGVLEVDGIFPYGISEEKLLSLAASVEQESSHILARSLVNFVTNRGLPLESVSNATEITAKGILAKIGQNKVYVGKATLIPDVPKDIKTSQTTIYVSENDIFLGYITFKDTIRPAARDTMAKLKALGVKNLVMLTGDKAVVAKQVAKEVGITTIHADCLPQDKIMHLKEVRKDDRPVVMVGDGVNDAPALVVADVGIAMGAHGSTTASESADAVILKDDLSHLSTVVDISQDTIKVAKQSVLLSLFICMILMLIASTGIIPTLLGAIFQEVIDTLSILSALRARRDVK